MLIGRNPWILVAGTGFGSAYETGSNAHMLYLHLVLEAGLPGLIVFFGFMVRILRALWLSGTVGRPLFSVTLALLLTGVRITANM